MKNIFKILFRTNKLLVLICLLVCNIIFAQTINLVTSNTACKNSGTVTVNTSGIASPTFQLQTSTGIVVAPVANNSSQFTSSNVFTALPNGTYKVVARDNVGTLFTSSDIIVVDGYTNMSITANTITLPCIGATSTVPVSITGGKAPYVYQIINAATSGILQTSAGTSSTGFTFNALPQGSYTVSITDSCGVTVVVSVSINNPALVVSNIKASTQINPTRNSVSCGALSVNIGGGFVNATSGILLTTAERANFSYKLKYLGLLYGQDVNADGFSDSAGAAYPMSITQITYPIGVTRDNILTNLATTKIVIFDQCGNTKELDLIRTFGAVGAATDCINGSRVQAFIGPSLACLPISWVFTNISNSADVITVTQTTNGEFFSGFTPGAIYSYTHVDSVGASTEFFAGAQSLGIPINSNVLSLSVNVASTPNINILDFGSSPNLIVGGVVGGSYNYEITASNNSLVPVGTMGSGTSGTGLSRINASHPINNWPKGTYTLKISNACGTNSIAVTIAGYQATITSNTISPVCGGFNYIMNGTFDVPSDYEVVITSGPSNIGLTQGLSSTTASSVFSGLAYGTYTAKLRISGGTTYIGSQDFTYGATNVITVDSDNTGGYVCSAGGTDGTLTILASTISSPPNNLLEYRLSLDGGSTYGAWQNSNVFAGLTNTTYTFQVKDGCGNIVTNSAQVGAVSAPQALASVGVVCKLDSLTVLQLGVDTSNATYLWTGPGIITGSNDTLKNPVLNINNLNVGINNYTVAVTSSFCNTVALSSTTITVLPSTKNPATTGTEQASLVGISTQGSLKWKDNVKNGALVLESSDKGFVVTRLPTSQFPTGASAVKGMMAYDTDLKCMKLYDGSAWKCIGRICL